MEYLGRRGELFVEENSDILDNTINLEQLQKSHQDEKGWSQRLYQPHPQMGFLQPTDYHQDQDHE